MKDSPPPEPSPSDAAAAGWRTWRQWQAHAEQALAGGASREEVLAGMVAQGCPQEQARTILEQALATRHKSANAFIGCGAAIALAGMVLLVGGLRTLSSSGRPTELGQWAGVIYGAIVMLAGWAVGIVLGLARKLRLR